MRLLAEQPEIGRYWPEMQIRQGFALLRVTPSAVKPFYPEIVD